MTQCTREKDCCTKLLSLLFTQQDCVFYHIFIKTKDTSKQICADQIIRAFEKTSVVAFRILVASIYVLITLLDSTYTKQATTMNITERQESGGSRTFIKETGVHVPCKTKS